MRYAPALCAPVILCAFDILLISLLPGCSSKRNPRFEQQTTPYVGVRDFPFGDDIVIEEIQPATKDFSEGIEYVVRGHYRLRSHKKAILYLGATSKTPDRAAMPKSPTQHKTLNRGQGSFELRFTMPSQGCPYLCFYNRPDGSPFGWVYFGKHDSMQEASHWASHSRK